MPSRQEKITALFNHPWYYKQMKKLTSEELKIMSDFIDARPNHSKGDFVHDVNRFLVNQKKTKNWTLVLEILTGIA